MFIHVRKDRRGTYHVYLLSAGYSGWTIPRYTRHTKPVKDRKVLFAVALRLWSEELFRSESTLTPIVIVGEDARRNMAEGEFEDGAAVFPCLLVGPEQPCCQAFDEARELAKHLCVTIHNPDNKE